jgi:hypothetical protein
VDIKRFGTGAPDHQFHRRNSRKRNSMGHSVRRSSRPANRQCRVPKSRLELDIDMVDFHRLKVICHDMGSDIKAKPYDVNGAVIVYAVFDISLVKTGVVVKFPLTSNIILLYHYTFVASAQYPAYFLPPKLQDCRDVV